MLSGRRTRGCGQLICKGVGTKKCAPLGALISSIYRRMRHSSRSCSRPVASADQTRLAGARTAQFGEYKRQEQLTRDQHRALVHVEARVVVRVVRLTCLAPAAHVEEGPGYPLEVVGEVLAAHYRVDVDHLLLPK